MNPKTLLATVFLLGPGLSTPLQAETWGLERATAYALENNPELQAARAQRDAAGARTRVTEGARLPELGLSHTVRTTNNPLDAFADKLNTRRTTSADFEPARVNHPGTSDIYMTSLALSLPLYTGGKLSADIASATELEKYTRLQYERRREIVAYQVLEAYLGLQAAETGLGLAEDAVKAARGHAQTTAQLAREGRIVVSDKLTAEVSLAAIQAQHEQAATRLARARDRLKLVMGLTLESDVRILPLALDAGPALARHLAESEAAALARRKDIEGLRALAQAAQARTRGAQAAHKPKVNVIASSNWYDKEFDTANNSWSVRGVASLDLYAGGRHTNEVVASQAEAREYGFRVRALEQAIRNEVRAAHDALREAGARNAIAREAATRARDSVRLVKERYGQGRTILIDLLQAERALVEARTEELASGVALRAAETGLRLAEGTLEAAPEQQP